VIDEAERLDAAFDTRPEVVGPDLRPLLEVAAEVARFLEGQRLSSRDRRAAALMART
jgi:hypothetical protein